MRLSTKKKDYVEKKKKKEGWGLVKGLIR